MASKSELQRRLKNATTLEEIEAIEAEMNGDDYSRFEVKSLGEVARHLGLQTQTVKDMRVGPDPLPGSEGHWNMIDILKWRYDRLARQALNSRSPAREALEVRILAAKAESVELETQSQRGELVLRSAVRQTLASILNSVRVSLEEIPSQIGPSIPADIRSELSHIIGNQVKLILRKLSQQRQECESAVKEHHATE